MLQFVWTSLKVEAATFNLMRTEEGQLRPKYIFNKCGTSIYFFTLQRFGPSPSPNFKTLFFYCVILRSQSTGNTDIIYEQTHMISLEGDGSFGALSRFALYNLQ